MKKLKADNWMRILMTLLMCAASYEAGAGHMYIATGILVLDYVLLIPYDHLVKERKAQKEV